MHFVFTWVMQTFKSLSADLQDLHSKFRCIRVYQASDEIVPDNIMSIYKKLFQLGFQLSVFLILSRWGKHHKIQVLFRQKSVLLFFLSKINVRFKDLQDPVLTMIY